MGKAVRRLSNGNGKLDPSKLPIGGKVSLTEGERESLRKLDQTSAQLKIELANVELQIAGLSRSKATIIEALEKQGALVREQAAAVVRSHGIDPEIKDRGWSLNLQEMAIIRTA